MPQSAAASIGGMARCVQSSAMASRLRAYRISPTYLPDPHPCQGLDTDECSQAGPLALMRPSVYAGSLGRQARSVDEQDDRDLCDVTPWLPPSAGDDLLCQ